MIEIKQRATLETKEYNIDFSYSKELSNQTENEGKTLKEKSDEDIQKNADDMSKYPFVYLDGLLIENTQIQKLKLFNDGFMPYLSLEFTDGTNKIIDDNFPVDNSIISIFKDSDVEDVMGIKMDFKITDFKIIKGGKGESISYSIEAIVDVDDFYIMNFESFDGNTFNVLKDISSSMGLGFASNITSTEDEMIWINNANYRIEFMKNIVQRSYIDDDTFLFGYLDYYYNFNYVDIETQLKSDISEQMNLVNKSKAVKDTDPIETSLILTNNPDKKDSNMHIDKYTIINSSTNINLQYGYEHVVTFYDKLEYKLNRYTIDSVSNDDDGNTIIMKGNEEEGNKLYNDMKNATWMGKIDTDNVHENFLHCQVQNKNNLKFLQKLKITIKMTKPNYGLYRFQKVLVELYNNGKTTETSKLKDPEIKGDTPTQSELSQSNDDKIINKLSGEWLITAINMTYDIKVGNIQEITLVKRELTKKYDFPRREK